MVEDELDFSIHPTLNDTESRHAKRINVMCNKHGLEKEVPYSLAKREDFSFEGELVPSSSSLFFCLILSNFYCPFFLLCRCCVDGPRRVFRETSLVEEKGVSLS